MRRPDGLARSFAGRPELLKKRGKHRASRGGCLYVNRLGDVNLDVLRSIFERAYRHGGSGSP